MSLSKSIVKSDGGLAQLEMELTIVGNFNKPVLKEVFKGENGKIGFSVVRTLVTRFLNSFTFTTKLTDAQIDILAVDALDRFSHESLEDMILFFKMARSGRFGAAKKGVDSNLIFGEWFPKFLELKSEERETMIKQKQDEYKANAVSANDVAFTYAKMQERKKIEKYTEYVDGITKHFDRQMLEDTILTWSKNKEMQPLLGILKKKRKTIVK